MSNAHDLRPQLERRTRRFIDGKWTLNDFARTYVALVESDIALCGANGETGEGLSLIAIFMCIFQQRLTDELQRAKDSDPEDGVDFEEVLTAFMEKETQLYTLLSVMACDELEMRKQWQANRPDEREEALRDYLRQSAVDIGRDYPRRSAVNVTPAVAAGAEVPDLPEVAVVAQPEPPAHADSDDNDSDDSLIVSLGASDADDESDAEAVAAATEELRDSVVEDLTDFTVVQSRRAARRARQNSRRARKELHPAPRAIELPAPGAQ